MAEKLPYFSELVNLDNNPFGLSPLLCATINQEMTAETRQSIISLLLEHGAHMMLASNDGMTVLHYAATFNNVRLLDFYI